MKTLMLLLDQGGDISIQFHFPVARDHSYPEKATKMEQNP
jgi:hypothetical protein